MNLSFDIFAMLYFIALGFAIFWALAMLGIKRGNRNPNRILAVLLFMISFGIAITVLNHTKLILKIPHLVGITFSISFIYPPLFYLYVRSLILKEVDYRKQLLHFVPAAIGTIYFLPFFLKSGAYKADYFISTLSRPTIEQRVVAILIIIQELTYIVLSLILLVRHSKKVKAIYSTVEKYSLTWIRNLIIAYALITKISSYLAFHDVSIHIGPIVMVAFIYVLGYIGVRQPAVFVELDKSQHAGKYQKSGLTQDKANRYLKKLTEIMESEKPFTDSELTLPKLASRLSISSNHLSQLLNGRLNQTFFDFINFHRVEEAKKQLHNPANNHLTLLAIAFNAGFNSKSSFNSAFKKHVKMTPSKYKLSTSGNT